MGLTVNRQMAKKFTVNRQMSYWSVSLAFIVFLAKIISFFHFIYEKKNFISFHLFAFINYNTNYI